MKHNHYTLLFLLILAPLCAMGMSQSNKALLRQLDHELELTHEHELKKEMRIEQLKHQAQLASSPEERYWYLRKVLDEYSVYDSDSAQAYGREALSVAQALKRADLTNDIRLLNAYAMAAAGLLEQSRAQWEAVDTTVLDSLSYSTYLDQKVYQTTHENQYRDMMATPSKQAAKVKRTLQTLADTACPTHPDYWYYQAYNSLITGDSVPQVLAALEPVLATRAYDSRQDARLAWASLKSTHRSAMRRIISVTSSSRPWPMPAPPTMTSHQSRSWQPSYKKRAT